MEIVVAGIAVMAFAATVFVLAGAAGRRRPDTVRTVPVAEGDEWLGVDELAAELDVSTGEIGALVERGDVPFFLVGGGELSKPEHWRFRRDEIDAWTIGEVTGPGRLRGGPLNGAPACSAASSLTWKDEPQPQAATTFGLLTVKPAPWRPST